MSDDTVADTSDDVTSDTNENEQPPLPQRGGILYVPLASYYYTDGSGPSVPEPDKNWHVRQQIITAKWRGKNKRRKFVINGIGDFGDKYEREWGVWKEKLQANLASAMTNDFLNHAIKHGKKPDAHSLPFPTSG